jgi:hypothetical protein
METMQIKPTTQLSRKQIIGLFLAKFPANQPLNQMFIEPKVLRVFLPI